MKTLKKLHQIEKQKCIYDIHYCKAGIGFLFYNSKEDKTSKWQRNIPNNGLSVARYYPTFEEAVEAEFEKLMIKNKYAS